MFHSILSSDMKHTSLLKGCHLSWMSYYPTYAPKAKVAQFKRFVHKEDIYGMYLKTVCGKSYVSFRGSHNMKELLNAITSKPTQTEYGLVHKAFWDRYNTIRDSMATLLSVDDSDSIYCVGHSMGGCLAMYAALDISLSSAPSKDINCYMFGSPVSTDERYLINTQTNIDRLLSVEICNDVIPKYYLNDKFTKAKQENILNLGNHSNTVNPWECHSCSSYYWNLRKMITKLE